MNSLVSVIIPTYNYGHFVSNAINSVLAQTYSPFEVIVVDDGSTDNTEERLAAFRGDRRVRCIRQNNQGLSAARNTGISLSQGEYCALLDSDDIWVSDKLMQQMQITEELPDAGLIATDAFFFQEGTDPSPPPKSSRSNRTTTRYSIRDLLEFTAFSPSSVLIPRKCFQLVGLFDTKLRSVEDLDMWLRIAANYPVWRLNSQLIGSRLTIGSMSTSAESMLSNHQQVLDKAFSNITVLQSSPHLRRLADARMYTQVSWMRYTSGDRSRAVRDILHSLWLSPTALRNPAHHKERLKRAKLLLRYCFA